MEKMTSIINRFQPLEELKIIENIPIHQIYSHKINKKLSFGLITISHSEATWAICERTMAFLKFFFFNFIIPSGIPRKFYCRFPEERTLGKL